MVDHTTVDDLMNIKENTLNRGKKLQEKKANT